MFRIVLVCRSVAVVLVSFYCLFFHHCTTHAKTESPVKQTQQSFRRVICMDDARYHYYKDVFKHLSYPQLRTMRIFCSLPDVTADQAIKALENIVFYPVTIDQVKILEIVARSPSTSPTDCWQLLQKTAKIEFTAMQALLDIGNVDGITARSLIPIIDTLNSLQESGKWALRSLFRVDNITLAEVTTGVELIASMGVRKQGTAEQCARFFQNTPQKVLSVIGSLAAVTDSTAANIGGLFSLSALTPEMADAWLHQYFFENFSSREVVFSDLPPTKKTTVLAAFFAAADYHIRNINNLHAITNQFGTEIGSASLIGKDADDLAALFNRLHHQAFTRYNTAFRKALAANDRYKAVELLKEATAAARQSTAQELSSANIYILLARGSELYDSSFRDILVPVLVERIRKNHKANLLRFLFATDPENNYTSDFIISCAQKGTLALFFPAAPAEQKKLLDLLCASAFKNKQSLIQFSATFNILLKKLTPETRTYLIKKMIGTIDDRSSMFSLQLRVILQYYREKQTNLLAEVDIDLIERLIQSHGSIELTPFISSDFKRWKEDNRLAGLSVFSSDDDGAVSYSSNCRNLLENGYRPAISELSQLPKTDETYREAQRLIRKEQKTPGSQIGNLYRLSVQKALVVKWSKMVNGITWTTRSPSIKTGRVSSNCWRFF